MKSGDEQKKCLWPATSPCWVVKHWSLIACQLNVYIHHCKHVLFWREVQNFPFFAIMSTTGGSVTLNATLLLLCALPNKLHSQIYNELTTACTYRFVLDQGTQKVVHGSFGAEQPTVSASAFSWEANIGSVWAWGIMKSFLLENRTHVSRGFGGQSFSKKSRYIKRVRL